MRNILRRATIPVLALFALAVVASPAMAGSTSGVRHLHFHSGPYNVIPGANQDLFTYNQPTPGEDGYITRTSTNLRYAKPDGTCCGAIPRVDVIHLHHAVWLSNSTAGRGSGPGYAGFYPFMGAGEEKTITQMPPGFGWAFRRSDTWLLNYMIHNLTPNPDRVYLTYDVDFVPANSALRPAHDPAGPPVWMDVAERPRLPGLRRQEGRRAQRPLHLPRPGERPLRRRPPLNEWQVDTRRHAGVDRGPRAPRRPVHRPRSRATRRHGGARPPRTRRAGPRPARAPTPCACSAPTRSTGTPAGRSPGTWP